MVSMYWGGVLVPGPGSRWQVRSCEELLWVVYWSLVTDAGRVTRS